MPARQPNENRFMVVLPHGAPESPDGPPRVLVNCIQSQPALEEAATEEIGMSLDGHLVELAALRGAAREAEQHGPAVRAEVMG